MTFVPEKPDCENCPITYRCRNVGTPTGPIDADIIVISDHPKSTELQYEEALMGDAGDLFWNEIPADLRDKIYVTHALRCKAPHKAKPHIIDGATRACADRLMSEIDAYPRKIIITLGNAATKSVTGNYAVKITQDRGQILPHENSEIGIFPIIHPAALLQGSGSFPQFKEDLKYALDLSRGSPKKQAIVCKPGVVTDDTIEAVVNHIISYEEAAMDIETGGLNRQLDEILCLGVAVVPEEGYVFPPSIMLNPKNKPHMDRMFKNVRQIWQFGKFDAGFLRREDIDFPDMYVHEDTGLLSYCLDESSGGHDLETLSKNLLGSEGWKHLIKPYLPKKSSSYRLIPSDVLYDYLGRDIGDTLQIFHILREKVRQDPALESLYNRMLIPASETLLKVENRGILMDMDRVAELSDPNNPDSIHCMVEDYKATLCDAAGYPLNPNSPQQVAKLLFDDIGFAMKKGRSTAKKVLAMLPDHPVIRALKQYRKYSKQYSTYVKGHPKHINYLTGAIHTSFLLHVTRTGRLASRDPNVQNVPRDPRIRGMYIARPGCIFLEIDLNQAELRCLAELSKCIDLIAIYLDPDHLGLHHEITQFLFGDGWTSEDKMRGKAVNFGIVYGREALSLAEEFDVSIEEAQRWIDGWFERFPGAAEFIKECRRAPIDGKTLTTLFGRKKRQHIVTRENLRNVQNQYANFPHQSIASDITLEACNIVIDEMIAINVHPLLLVHDSIMFEVPDNNPDLLMHAACRIRDVMEQVPLDRGLEAVPFIADAKIGTRWGSLETFKMQ